MRQTLKGFCLVAMTIAVLGMATLPASAADIFVTADITASETWTPDNVYILTQPIYVTNGATLTIEAGTVIRGEPESAPGANDPGTLIVSRDSKINAVGTRSEPIVFTDLFDDNIGANPGTFPYDNQVDALDLNAQWGGVILLGRGWVANDTAAGPNPSREVQIEGLVASAKGLYGNCAAVHPGDPLVDPSFCDDDDSGVMNYVSIRYGGFNLSAANEINGLTLGAVGRTTDLDYIEVFQNKDDGMEFFGGAAQLKHIVLANVGDDSIDYDEGWRGKGQFIFVMQGIPGTGADKSDKGGEHDGGNSPDDSQPFAIPTFYNVTMIGHGQKAFTDSDRNTGIHMRDNAGGRYYNSFWGDFGGATVLIEGNATAPGTSGERAVTPYVVDNEYYQPPASSFQLEFEDNDFWCFGRQEDPGTTPGTLCTGTGCTQWGGDNKDHYDNGLLSNAALDNTYYACSDPLPIRTLVKDDLAFDPNIPDQTILIDPRPVIDDGTDAPSPLWSTNRRAPGGFFTAASYKGAFQGRNWAACWSTMARLAYFPTCDLATAPEALPDEVINLIFTDKTTMVWDGLCWNNSGGYDVLRSNDKTDFSLATFIETGDTDTTAQDATVGTFFYVVRGNNPCGPGTIGYDSNGTERIAP